MPNHFAILVTTLLMGTLCGVEIDLFVPSFPDLQRTFNLSPFIAEWLLTINLVAYCVTSLIVGNLGDKYGRKPIILLGLFIFIVGSIFCIFAYNYQHLLIGRLMQGVGVAAPAVLCYLFIADLYSTARQQQLMGIFNGIITLAMAFAPVLGSYINLFFTWRGNFVALLLFGLLSFILSWVFLPSPAPRANVTISLKEYWPVLQSKKAIYYIIAICMFVQAYWVFIAIAPILYMQDLGVSLKDFGFYQGALAAAFSVGSFGSAYFLKKFGTKSCFLFSMGCLIVFIFGTCLLIIFDVKDPLTLTLVMLLLSFGIILPCNILWPLSLQAIPEGAGRMAAMIVSMKLITIAAGVQVVSYFYNGTFASLGISMIVALLIAMWTSYKLAWEGIVIANDKASNPEKT